MRTLPAPSTTTSDRLTVVLSYGALIFLGFASYLILAPFLTPLAWSAILAIFFVPLHARLSRRFRPNLAALLSTLLVTFLLIVPALVVIWYASREAIDAASRLQDTLLNPDSSLPANVSHWLRDQLPDSMKDADFSGPLRQAAERIAGFLAGKLGAFLKNLLAFFIDLFILLFSLFFMFRDGERIVRAVRHLLPFDAKIQDDVMHESRDLIFASVAVGLLVAAIQGALGATAFTIAGVHTPLFWGVVIAFFSFVPVVGSALVWVPTSLFLILSGHWGRGLVIVLICGAVAGIADNIIRPVLLRNRTRLNELLVFLSVLGGLQAFGLLGLVIGPAIIAAALGVFRVYMAHRDEISATSA